MVGDEPCMWIRQRNSDFLSMKGGTKLLKKDLRWLALPVVGLCKADQDIAYLPLQLAS